MDQTIGQNMKLHIAYVLKAMELLQNSERVLERAILIKLIEVHRHALAGRLEPGSLSSYPALKQVYRELSWHQNPAFLDITAQKAVS